MTIESWLTQSATNTKIYTSYINPGDSTWCTGSSWIEDNCERRPMKVKSLVDGLPAYYCTDLGGDAADAKGIYLFIDPNDGNNSIDWQDMLKS